MTTTELSPTTQEEDQADQFQSGSVLTVVGAHFVHDTFTAFVPPLLPLVIERLSLSLTAAGGLTALMQFPAILNPFIGYLADKISLRYFVIFAPAATATLIGLMGLAPNYLTLAVLFVLIGISVAAFHAPTPAMIARVAGKRVGLGMSLYMGAGELGRTVGPLVAVAGVTAWGLEGITRLIALGWGASLILLWRFRNVSSSQYRQRTGNLRAELPKLRSFFLPISLIVLTRSFLLVSATTYLPTFLNFEGASLQFSGLALAVLEGAGVIGALASGTLSDRFGRKSVLLAALGFSTVWMFVFLAVQGWWVLPVLALLGFFTLSAQPVLLAMVQDTLPDNRAAANGLYMFLAFLIMSLALFTVGAAGDALGLRTAFMLSGVLSVFSVVGVFLLPDNLNQTSSE